MKKQDNDIEKKQVCKECNIKKHLSEFYKDKTYKNGVKSKCKLCVKNLNKIYYQDNKVEHNDRMKKYRMDNPDYLKEYYLNNPTKLEIKKIRDKIYSKKRYINDPQLIREKQNEYYHDKCKNDPLYWEKRKDYMNVKYHDNIEFRLQQIIRSRIYQGIQKYDYKNENSSIEELGCDIKSYVVYLEKQFDVNMNWDNYGTYWEIDHTIPISKGGGFHYTNTTPMEITENRKKSNK